jgi:hypothetical protein
VAFEQQIASLDTFLDQHLKNIYSLRSSLTVENGGRNMEGTPDAREAPPRPTPAATSQPSSAAETDVMSKQFLVIATQVTTIVLVVRTQYYLQRFIFDLLLYANRQPSSRPLVQHFCRFSLLPDGPRGQF